MLGGPNNKQRARRKGRGSGGRGQPPQRQPQGFFPRREKVPAAVLPEKSPGLRYVAQGDLRDSFVLIMAAGEVMQQQLVFHHPIGVTELGEDEWVCSLQQDIPLLLMRKEDPQAKAREVRVSTELYRLAVESVRESGQSIHLDNGEIYINQLHRPSLIHQAKQLAKAANTQETSQGGPPPYFYFLGPTEQKVEMKLIFALRNPELIAQAEKNIPATGFVTYGGPANDKPQEPVSYLKGLTKVQAYDTMSRRIHAMIFGGREAPEEPSPTEPVQTGKEEKYALSAKSFESVQTGLSSSGGGISSDILDEWSYHVEGGGDKKASKPPISPTPAPLARGAKEKVPAPPSGGGVSTDSAEEKKKTPPSEPSGRQSTKVTEPAIVKQSVRTESRSNSSGGSNPLKKPNG